VNTHSRQLPVGLPFFEAMSVKLTSELGPEGTGRRLGMKAFENMTVLDVGTRDGRYIEVFRNLGASEVFGIDPDEVELQKAVSAGILDNEHAIPKFLADLPREIKGSFDLAIVFNFNIPFTAREGFLADLNESLNSNGQAVLTFAETEVLNATLPILQRYFNVRTKQILGDDCNFPNKHLVIASKRIS
jgi:ribosomal protein L11 methylase PrmA